MVESTKPTLRKTGMMYEWMPGNGKRYLLAMTQTGNGDLVTWLRYSNVGGPSFLIFDDAREGMSVAYFMEKMNLTLTTDATAILNFLVKIEAIKSYGK